MHVHEAITAAVGAAPGVRVVEIGAGVGTLTAHLLASGADVWSIERDRDLCEVLREEFKDETGLRLLETDAVKFDYATAASEDQPRPAIAGNLPYHLTGPLLFKLLEHHADTGAWVVMIQKEVADRLCASPGNKTYGGITVALSRLRSIQHVLSVPPGCFIPPPKVDSAVIRIAPRETPRGEVPDQARFLALVRAAFQQRRKTIANTLKSLADRDTVAGWLEAADVDPKARPERLTVEQFAALARARDDA